MGDREVPIANIPTEGRWRQYVRRQHQHSLRTMKKRVDNDAPNNFPHLMVGGKRRYLKNGEEEGVGDGEGSCT